MRRSPTLSILFFAAVLLSITGCPRDPEKEGLLLDIHDLKNVIARLEDENRRMWQDLRERIGAERYIVVDTSANKLYLREGEKILLETVVSTGSGKLLAEEGGRKWTFNTPKGMFAILHKEEDPTWYKPDWAFVEDNLPIPPPNSPERMVKGMLGKYALDLGGGYKIHGTPYKKHLGQSVTHGCIRLGDHELETLYNSVNVKTRVYIY